MILRLVRQMVGLVGWLSMLAGWLAPRIGGLPPAPPRLSIVAQQMSKWGRLRPPTPPPKGGDRLGFNCLSIDGRLRICALSLVICTLLVGCQGGRDSSSGVTRLTLWQGVNPPPNRDVLNKLVDRFNQTHDKVQVESLYVGQGDQQIPKILAAAVGDAAPDLLWYAPMLTGQLVELEALRPLDDLLQQAPQVQELDPALRSTMAYDGKFWSVPFSTNNVGIYYRPSLFKAAGIKQLPKTWSEFRQVAQQLTRDTDGNGSIDQRGMLLPLGKGEWTVFTWLPFMWSGGGDLQAQGKVTIANPGAVAALKFWRSLVEDGTAVLSQPERGYELDGFINGKIAMQLSGPWTLAQLQDSPAAKDFAVMPIPQDQRPATVIGGENLFLFKSNPKREQAAFEFAQFVLSEGFQTDWAIGTGYLPVNLKSRQSAKYQDFKTTQPAVQTFLDQAQFGQSRPIFPGYNRISDNLGRAIEMALMGAKSPETALAESQQRLDLIFN
jgi:multiple sugar transport system substrate-binding protein